MKKQLLAIATVLIGFTSANAQCVITTSCTPDPNLGFCSVPDAGTALPVATQGSAYSTVIQVSVGTSAGGGFATISVVAIDNATLPDGLTYTTNPANGMIAGGSSGCIEISGTPTTAEVDAVVSFAVTATTSLGDFPTTLDYTLTVDASTNGVYELTQNAISLYPNPAGDQITIAVTEPTTVNVVDVVGASVMQEEVTSFKVLDISTLNNGIYFVVDAASGKSTKFVKK
ncbi:MAG: T9SS type A sorting domain-containing protein [Bacteroidota bacterium]